MGSGASLAGVLRDEQGRVEWCLADRCHNQEVEVVEAFAIRRGLHIALNQGVRWLQVESEALGLVQQFLKSLNCLSYTGRIVKEIQELVKGFDRVNFTWDRRSGNSLA